MLNILTTLARVAKAIVAAIAGAVAVLATAPQPYSQLTYVQAGIAAVVAGGTVYFVPNAAPAAPAAAAAPKP